MWVYMQLEYSYFAEICMSTRIHRSTGQTCIAPDYILVHKDVVEVFVQKLKAKVEKSYGGEFTHIDPRDMLF